MKTNQLLTIPFLSRNIPDRLSDIIIVHPGTSTTTWGPSWNDPILNPRYLPLNDPASESMSLPCTLSNRKGTITASSLDVFSQLKFQKLADHCMAKVKVAID